ncbi:MAG: coproporphyrinogen dehydrogenase HemZ [Lachnospiraceae bacterium]|nr:coproporphyrinogen dehydrogenase HemZ [Lachnospiraceae bacterium]
MKKDDLIVVTVNSAGFEYDIHSLVKAFYPACDVKVTAEESEDSSGSGLPDLNILFEKEAILISLNGGEEGMASFAAKKVEIAEDMQRAEVKNRLKQLIYTVLAEHTGRHLPWGTLTGIRPTKIPMTMLEEGASDEDILAYMQKTYFAGEEKSALALEIAKREKALLDTLHYENGYSLYIGIPFCPSTCLYCSFTSYPVISWKKRIGEYLEALEKEIDFVAECYRDKVLDTVYIGGGTPTALEADELERLLRKIRETLDLSHLKELTVEAGRADSITMDKLKILKKYGVNRISINPQTMKQETLDLIGRKHTVNQVKEAFQMAREAGFTNINMDLILGLPGEEAVDVRNTIEQVGELKPDSLTVHSLAIKRASKLSQWIQENGISTLRNTDETMRIAGEGARKMGMEPYYLYRQKNMSGNFENVGYAKEGCFGIYNILIMEEKQSIVALGAGSISKRVYPDGRIERCDNVKDVALYIEKIDEMIERKRVLLSD